MSGDALKGMKLFYGRADCADCHSGTFQTDLEFHAIGIPQIGPGFGGVGFQGREDFGREGVTGDPEDRYKFRTPSLRNVALTAPYGHDGFYRTLERRRARAPRSARGVALRGSVAARAALAPRPRRARSDRVRGRGHDRRRSRAASSSSTWNARTRRSGT
jgi:hypothetical protein